jgi:hypothetical protein
MRVRNIDKIGISAIAMRASVGAKFQRRHSADFASRMVNAALIVGAAADCL